MLDKAIKDADQLASPGASLATRRHAFTLGVASSIMVDRKLGLARGVRIEVASVLYQMVLTLLPATHHRARAWITTDLIVILKARSACFRDPTADNLDHTTNLCYSRLFLPPSAGLDSARTLNTVLSPGSLPSSRRPQ